MKAYINTGSDLLGDRRVSDNFLVILYILGLSKAVLEIWRQSDGSGQSDAYFKSSKLISKLEMVAKLTLNIFSRGAQSTSSLLVGLGLPRIMTPMRPIDVCLSSPRPL